MDELLYIFKFSCSRLEDKNPNRYIRNELIGHPIRKKTKGNILNSSVLFALHKELSNDIKYTKYSKDNNFRPEPKEYKVKDIIENHMNFLNYYLDKIINKLLQDELKYNEKLNSIINIPLEKQFDFIDNFDKQLLSGISTFFEKDNLKYYYENQTKHKRYVYCIEYYKKTLASIIDESKVEHEMHRFDNNVLDIMCLDDFEKLYSSENFSKAHMKKLNGLDAYAIEQLFKKDEIFNIDFYIKVYSDNKEVLEELLHMKKNINNDIEYYASLEYLIAF